MTGGVRSPAAIAAGAAAAWLVLVALAWFLLGTAGVALLAALAPLGAIGLAARSAGTLGRAEEDRAGLRRELAGLRAELRRLPRAEPADASPAEGAPDRPERAVAPRPEPEPEPEEEAEPEPPPRPRPPPIGTGTLVRALNFPEDADDRDGFEALRLALADPQSRRLVQASQDVLTLLSQNGVYMDDLEAEPAPPAVWRRFAGGVRGPGVSEVGGVRDEDALELARARMSRDTVFRDAVQHFLRQFDLGLQRFVGHASDDELSLFAETRTALAFMLLARAARLFD